jgi:hypothetical protein
VLGGSAAAAGFIGAAGSREGWRWRPPRRSKMGAKN